MPSAPVPNFPQHLVPPLHSDGGQPKKRRTDRACDACRRKKTKCDGPWKPTNVCSNCTQSRKPCTYLEASKPRGPPKAYVVGLEDRVEELEALLAQIRPGVDFSDELGPPIVRDSWKDREDVPRAKTLAKMSSTSTLQDSRSASSIPQSSGSASPVPTSRLPPLTIPWDQSHTPGARSPPTRTTHLRFHSKSKLKKKRPGAPSGMTPASSGSTSSCAPMATDSPSCPSSAGSENESQSDAFDSDSSEDLFISSLAGRAPFTLKMNEIPHAEDNKITFHGRSSTAGLVEATRKFKFLHLQEFMKMNVAEQEKSGENNNSATPATTVSDNSSTSKSEDQRPDNSRVAMTRRPWFWQTPYWELGADQPSPIQKTISADLVDGFPPQDLCQTLIDLYFTHCNRYFPLLHQPTFQRQWDDRLHDTNFWFASTCLMLFAVASRWCTDERVLENRNGAEPFPSRPGGESGDINMGEVSEASEKQQTPDQEYSHAKRWWYAGLRFFVSAGEVIRANANMVHQASLFEVQTLALMGTFLRATTAFPTAWVIVSIGLRRALDAGAHRKKVYRPEPNTDDELWKRAFWHLVVFDRLGGVILGRSVGIGEEDFDLELPLEVDDAYWGDKYGWKQPPDVPCTVTAFNHYIKLTQIVAFISKTIYAINPPKLFTGLLEGDWRTGVITQLNTTLDEWDESTPTYLKWSEDIPDPALYNLSATLAITYELTRLLIYRPFIPPPPLLPQSLRSHPHAPSAAPVPFPALAICISSARALTRILERLRKRSVEVNIPALVNGAYVAGGLLLLAFWDLKGQQKALIKLQGAGVVSASSTSSSGEPNKDGQETEDPKSEEPDSTEQVLQGFKVKMEELLADIHILIEILEWVEPRWQFAAPMIAQLTASLPEREDMEDRLPAVPKGSIPLRKSSFQDLRRQRSQKKAGKQPQVEGGDNLRRRPSHPVLSLERVDDASSAAPLRHNARRHPVSAPPNPALFLQDNYHGLHTLRDEDFDDVQDGRIQLPRVDYDSSMEPRHHSSALYSPEHLGQARFAYPPSTASSSMSHTSSGDDTPHFHDLRRRPSYQHDERLPHSQSNVYTHDGFAHPMPYISSSTRRSSLALPHPSDGREVHNARQDTADSYADALPPKFRSVTSSARSSISMDLHHTIDEDRKPLPATLSPPILRRHGDDVDSQQQPHVSGDRYYYERRSNVRTAVPFSFPSSPQPELELRYPWASNQDRRDAPSVSYAPSSDGHWKPQHHEQQGGASGHSSNYHPSAFTHFPPGGIQPSHSQERSSLGLIYPATEPSSPLPTGYSRPADRAGLAYGHLNHANYSP